MKKAVLALLIAVVCISLSACGTTDSASNEKEILFDKYEDVIRMLENEEYDNTIAAIEAMKPAPAIEADSVQNNEINFIIVELTVDNFHDYFKLADEPVPLYDSFGEPTDQLVWPYVSNVYDDGLVFWKTDGFIQYEFTSAQAGISGGGTSSPYEGFYSYDGTEYEFSRIKGTMIFVSKDDIASYVFEEPGDRTITLVNGESSSTKGGVPPISNYPQYPY